MSFVLILLMMATPNSQAGMITSQQIGPYETMQECEYAKNKAVKKLENDTGVTIKGSCVQEEFQDKEVKLYKDDKDIN